MGAEKIINRTQYTLGSLLEELKESTPKFEKGQYFETLKSFYPSKEIPAEDRIMIIENKEATKPLACSSKNKREFSKDGHPFASFFKENTRGDILEVIETDGITAKCINRSLREDIIKEHYDKPELRDITITFNDIVNGNIKRVYRGIKKLIN